MTKRFFLIIRKCSKKLFDDVHMYIAEYYSLSFHVQRFKLFELLFKYNFLLSNQSRGLTPAPPKKIICSMIIQLFYSSFLSLQIEDFETATETEYRFPRDSRKILFQIPCYNVSRYFNWKLSEVHV